MAVRPAFPIDENKRFLPLLVVYAWPDFQPAGQPGLRSPYAEIGGVLAAVARTGRMPASVALQARHYSSARKRGHGRLGFVRY